MRLDRGVNDSDIDFVMDDIEHRGHQFGTTGDGCLARLKIDLHTESFAEILQYRGRIFPAGIRLS